MELSKKITSDKETLEALNRNVEYYRHNLDGLGQKIRQARQDRAKAGRTIGKMIQWMNENEANPAVRVFGDIFEGTEIVSPNTSLVLKDDYCNVKIREVERPVPPSEPHGKKAVHHAFEVTRTRRQSVRI